MEAINLAQQEIKDQVEVQQEQLKQAKAKAEAPVDTSDPAFVPFDQAPKAFGSEQEVIDFMAKRAAENPEGVPKERIREILGSTQIVSEEDLDAVQKITTPLTPAELAQEAKAKSPQEGTIYYSGEAGSSYGYKVVPGGVQFVFSDGRLKKTVFDQDSAQYKEMIEFFEKTK
jgi:hypothetical protein